MIATVHARRRTRTAVFVASVSALIVESLTTAIDLVRADDDFTDRARELLERDKELLDRLAH